MLRFVPPKLLAKYAVFLDHGNGKGFFRTYDLLGSAKYSFRIHNGPPRGWNRTGKTFHSGKILELIDGEWFTLYDVPAGSEHLPWERDFGQERTWYNRRTGWHSIPMTREEYGDWRARVERERLEIITAGNPS
jgi:hypothetical protein